MCETRFLHYRVPHRHNFLDVPILKKKCVDAGDFQDKESDYKRVKFLQVNMTLQI